ncbi:MAG: hypothetical protein V1735_07455 [Nanoarchaeota archaeon]
MGQVKELGRGRSGSVYLEDSGHRPVAVKTFSQGDGLTKLVNIIVQGAPNPYSWNQDAVLSAHHRRKILKGLVDFWFADRLGVADSYGTSWNSQANAYELKTEYIDGRAPLLHSPFARPNELSDLVDSILTPLQGHLHDAGFDGLLWQAGLGNPVAANNFLLEETGRWVWIDLESGVPAIVPLRGHFSRYLPAMLKHGRPLFDDVDTVKLSRYLRSNLVSLQDALGDEQVAHLQGEADLLSHHQARWKSLSRMERGIASQEAARKISPEQAAYFRDHPLAWGGRLGKKAAAKAWNKVTIDIPVELHFRLLPDDWKHVGRLIFKESYRVEHMRQQTAGRIEVWRQGGHLSDGQANELHSLLEQEQMGHYLTDFYAHMLLKAGIKLGELVVVPTLCVTGMLDLKAIPASAMFLGSASRTAYTTLRMATDQLRPSQIMTLPARLADYVHDSFRQVMLYGPLHGARYAARRAMGFPRFIALVTGALPIVGDSAYPLQIMYSGSKESKPLAMFLLYDISTRIGEHLPIYGGKDTRTEHLFNRLPDILAKIPYPLAGS